MERQDYCDTRRKDGNVIKCAWYVQSILESKLKRVPKARIKMLRVKTTNLKTR